MSFFNNTKNILITLVYSFYDFTTNNLTTNNLTTNNLTTNNLTTNNFTSNNFTTNNLTSNNLTTNNLTKMQYNDIVNYKENFYINYPNYCNLFFCISTIIVGDFFLIFLFGHKGRWFQLHAFTNLLIVINILPEIKNIMIYNNYSNNSIENNISSFYIIILHLYHILVFKNLHFFDYFHHIFFIGFGVVPNVLFLKTNQCFLAYITSMGIPGFIEYTSLTLYKNNYIKLLTQKNFISLIYNYVRYPLCVLGVSLNYNNYKNGYLIDDYYLTIYLNFLLFLNGSIFNYLTLNSFYKYKYEIKTAIDIRYSRKNN